MGFFIRHFIKGISYAFLFLGISALMGAIYGMFGGLIGPPMVFGTTITGVYVILNFPVATALVTGNLLWAVFAAPNWRITRYFAYSAAFLAVFMAFFGLLKLFGIEPF